MLTYFVMIDKVVEMEAYSGRHFELPRGRSPFRTAKRCGHHTFYFAQRGFSLKLLMQTDWGRR